MINDAVSSKGSLGATKNIGLPKELVAIKAARRATQLVAATLALHIHLQKKKYIDTCVADHRGVLAPTVIIC